MNLYAYLAAAVLSLLLLGGSGIAGWHYGSKHVQARWDADKAAQTTALAQAQAKVIAAQAASQAALEAARSDYATRLKIADTTSDTLRALLLRYENQLRARSLSLPAPTAGGAATSAQEPSSNRSTAVVTAAGDAGAACSADAAQLGALIQWVQKTLFTDGNSAVKPAF